MAVRVAYEPTFRDFLSLNLWIARRPWRMVRSLSIVMIALYLASTPFFHDVGAEGLLLPYSQSLAVLIPPAVLLAGLPVARYLAARKRWNAAPEIREPRRFTFSDGGFDVEGRTVSAHVAWSHITGAESYRGLIILKTNQRVYYLFPESGFPDEAGRQAFAALVRTKVSPTFGRVSVLGRVKFLEPFRSVDRGA